MSSLDLAVIGNCSFGALLDRQARIVWSCMPRFDGDPVFCSLLDGPDEPRAGFFAIDLENCVKTTRRYRRNSAVLCTRLEDSAGSAIEITDFAPRFNHFGRIFRPMTLVRRVRPVSGTPRITIRLRPACDYGAGQPRTTRGTNHVRYVTPDLVLRLTTNAPISYILEEVPFVLETPIDLLLGPDESLRESVVETARGFFESTDDYWRDWTRSLALPFDWQEAVIRAAITLKLCSFEESGAIIAAMTTSIPEEPGSGRTWDYRFCWLRDSYFVVHALNSLGATRTMEGYLNYITNIVAGSPDGYLQPVFGVTQQAKLDESVVTSLGGYRGMGPVRTGNGAYQQVQNDGYGSVILATAQSFFDSRLEHPGDPTLFQRLEVLGEQAVQRWDEPDAGLWEFRTREQVHTYSSVMCWAACDRLARIAGRLGLKDREAIWQARAQEVHDGIVARTWNAELNSFSAIFSEGQGPVDGAVDASLLLLPQLGFVQAQDPRFLGTLERIEARLKRGNHLLRYDAPDDFGAPRHAFNVCTFWYIEALISIGRREEARELFEAMLGARNELGLLSEDLDPQSGELWGNFPQTYSMVGLIHSAIKLSRSWEEVF